MKVSRDNIVPDNIVCVCSASSLKCFPNDEGEKDFIEKLR